MTARARSAIRLLRALLAVLLLAVAPRPAAAAAPWIEVPVLIAEASPGPPADTAPRPAIAARIHPEPARRAVASPPLAPPPTDTLRRPPIHRYLLHCALLR